MNVKLLGREITFVRAGAADADAFALLERKSAGRLYGPIGTVDDALREIKSNILYLMRLGDIVVGSIAYRMRADDSAYISCLNVDQAYRRQGIARAAMAHVFAQIKGVGRVDLVTHPDNENALGLYLSLGFRVEKRCEDYFGDGEPRLVLSNPCP